MRSGIGTHRPLWAASELVRLLGQCGLLRHEPHPREPPSTAKGLHRDIVGLAITRLTLDDGWRRCSPQSMGFVMGVIESEVGAAASPLPPTNLSATVSSARHSKDDRIHGDRQVLFRNTN